MVLNEALRSFELKLVELLSETGIACCGTVQASGMGPRMFLDVVLCWRDKRKIDRSKEY